MIKKGLKYLLLLAVLVIVYRVYNQYPRLNILAGYSAKNMSSSVFLAGRSFEFTDANDNDFSPVNLASDDVNIEETSATASVYGLLTRKAIYREGLGSVLVPKGYKGSTIFLSPKRIKTQTSLLYPYGDLPQKDTFI